MAGIRDYSENANVGAPSGTLLAPGPLPLGLYPAHWARLVAIAGAAPGGPLGGFFPMPLPIKYGVGITVAQRFLKGSAPATFAAAADWTPGAGDVTISKDNGADANIGTLPSVLASTTYQWGIVLSATETQAKRLVVTVHDDGGAVVDDSFDFLTYGHPSAYWPTDFEALVLAANATQWAGAALATPDTAGYPKVTMKSGTAAGEIALTAGAVDSVGAVTGNVGGNLGGNVVGSVASVVAAVATTSNIKRNQALAIFPFVMRDATTKALVTGKTVTVTRSIDGAAFGAGALNGVVELSDGVYFTGFAASDLDGKVILLKATAAGCDPTFERIVTVP